MKMNALKLYLDILFFIPIIIFISCGEKKTAYYSQIYQDTIIINYFTENVKKEDCPCNMDLEPYYTIMRTPLYMLTVGERVHLGTREQKCAHWLLPTYKEKSRWIYLDTWIYDTEKGMRFIFYYDKNTFKYNDTLIECWIWAIESEYNHQDIQHIIYNIKNSTEYCDARIDVNTQTNYKKYSTFDRGYISDNSVFEKVPNWECMSNIRFKKILEIVLKNKTHKQGEKVE